MSEVVEKANALSNSNRVQILAWLKNPESHFGPDQRIDSAEGVCGLYIAEKLGVSPATASAHLKILTQAGFLRPLRIGKFTYFQRIEGAFTEFARNIELL
ncbi:winged helix-turn-helix domain-containing protein [Ensifer adhaerens]|uniref:ArsR/SmtB family transcription factor n=1 Tax=Ensifer adhaerens TaxID=106592 RepID=UPI001CBB3DB6|nr:winged helix-turn-helix domain-containing protein [Ensifer adhaerens]MBZ7924863.1 winged helix-turn-helix domain-containing protein [Ensifer adhaerens]UAX95920.1 winged helix-turn-helix domain-containing protein [Ensifer adhaerens]UAY04738.1 winged helix-turn-helix domain-containing protein [Ensifer adhaerens]UAY10169.1 winged helix-turn-helix domain-containing protein [Ensifer adhaerens]